MTPHRTRSPRPAVASRCAWPLVAAALALAPLACGGEETGQSEPPDYPLDDVLRLNHLQIKGTHNSYHQRPDMDPIVPDWDYSHAPLDVQLDKQGVRQFEIDIYWDSAAKDFNVLHAPIIDPLSSCAKLRDCLAVVDGWSTAHTDHVPIIIWIEPKNFLAYKEDDAIFANLRAAILGAVARDRLLTPDDVRGEHADLRSAVAATGWPTLGAVRGKLMLVLLDNSFTRDIYVQDDPALKDALLFAEGDADTPWGVVAKIDGPVAGKAAIEQAVAAGRIIRTRADSSKADITVPGAPRRQAALASGAQIVSTDYPASVAGTDYVVELPGGGPAHCNPITAPAECTDRALEWF